MSKLIFVAPTGRRSEVEAAEGKSVMTAARSNNVAGIEAECGGSLACATCHVYVDATFIARLAPPSPQENDMLELVAAERRCNSRLSCQIIVTQLLDGLILNIPDTQY